MKKYVKHNTQDPTPIVKRFLRYNHRADDAWVKKIKR